MLLRRSLYRSLALALGLTLLPLRAWGPTGHVMVTRAAVAALPADMPAFLRAGAMTVTYISNEPDRWRDAHLTALDAFNSPDHFINLERLAFLPALPPTRYAFLDALHREADRLRAAGREKPAAELTPDGVGMQPYAMAESYGRLVIALRGYRIALAGGSPTAASEQNVLYQMGILSHYVGDGAQPLHTSVNYDGWTEPNPEHFTARHGFHWAFESRFVDAAIPPDALTGQLKPPHILSAPFSDYVAYLRASHAELLPLYRLEKRGAFRGHGTPAGRAFVVARLAAGAQMLADLYLTAWQASAAPEL